MKLLKYLFFLLLISIIAFSIYIATRPGEYTIAQAITIDAPEEVVHDYISNYEKLEEWIPWIERDSGLIVSLGDTTKGKNASLSWNGKYIGTGTMKITKANNDTIVNKVNFITPYQFENNMYWNLSSNRDSGTEVTWGITGNLSFKEKIYALYLGGLDKMFKPDLNKGLKKLDSLITTDISKYSISNKGIADFGGGFYLYITKACKQEDATTNKELLFSRIRQFMKQNDIRSNGLPFILYHNIDDLNNTITFSACTPVKDRVAIASNNDVLCGFLPQGRYGKTILNGNYTHLEEAWVKAKENITKKLIFRDIRRDPMEVYVKTPKETANPAEWITEIYIPVREKITMQKSF